VICRNTAGRDIKMKIKAIGERVIVKALEQTQTKSGNIYLPNIRNTRPTEAEVIDVGFRINEKGEKEKLPIGIGDTAYFSNITGYQLKSDELDKDENAQYFVLNWSDIFAVVKKGSK